MKKIRLSPYLIIILGFIAVILIGTILLLLPFSTYDNVYLSFIDAFFTSTSAVCITGLVSISSLASTYTIFGKIVIVLLVEVGGLGFVTIVMFILTLIGTKIGISDRLLIKESLNQNKVQGVVALVRRTVVITLTCQLIGAIINFIVFINDFTFWKALGYSVFHSITAFNNAGFDIIGTNSFVNYSDNILFNLNISLLIIIGGIGFIVINDILRNKKYKKLSIHSKIVLKTTLGLIITGTFLLKITEVSNITWLEAYFNTVAARTAGFRTIDFSHLTNAGIMVMLTFMFIGAAPSSTGGGIKVTSFYTVSKTITSFAKGKENISHNRKISDISIMKAFILVLFSISFITIVVFLLLIIENYNQVVVNDSTYLRDIVFEVVSGFSNTGNSTGITKDLLPISKFILCITMFIGRLGPITIISVMNKNWYKEKKNTDVKYIEEKIIIG